MYSPTPGASPEELRRREAEVWEWLDPWDRPDLLELFINNFPGGANAAKAKVRLAKFAGAFADPDKWAKAVEKLHKIGYDARPQRWQHHSANQAAIKLWLNENGYMPKEDWGIRDDKHWYLTNAQFAKLLAMKIPMGWAAIAYDVDRGFSVPRKATRREAEATAQSMCPECKVQVVHDGQCVAAAVFVPAPSVGLSFISISIVRSASLENARSIAKGVCHRGNCNKLLASVCAGGR